jgi:hypothetical protein
MAEVFLTQPLQIVAGSLAGSKWMSDDLYKRAASTNKKFHVVEGSNHMQLYDVPNYIDEAVSVLAPFFKSNARQPACNAAASTSERLPESAIETPRKRSAFGVGAEQRKSPCSERSCGKSCCQCGFLKR